MCIQYTHKSAVFSSILLIFLLEGCAHSDRTQQREKSGESVVLAEDFDKNRHLKKDRVHPRVQERVRQFEKNPAIFSHLDKDRQVILKYILGELKKRDMPAEIAMIPLIESSYRPNASNRGRYVGLWQFGTQTAKNFGLPVRGNYDGRYNLKLSTKAALDYMEYLNKMFDGDWLLTFAAYNAGEGRVLKSIRANAQAGRQTDYWSLTSLPPVTKAYIPKVLALSEMVVSRPQLKSSSSRLEKLVQFETQSNAELKKILGNTILAANDLKFYNPNFAQNKSGVRMVMIPEQEIRKLKGSQQLNTNEHLE